VIRVSLNNEIHLLFLTLPSDKDKVPAAAELPQQRKRIVLQPRSVPVEVTSPTAESESNHSEEEASIEMTEEAALKKISEDLKEFFAVRNLEEAEVYFSSLPLQHHHVLVDKIVSTAVESKEDDAKLVSQFFELAALKKLCSAASFEQGLTPVAEIIDDIAIDAPKAFQLLAMMVKAASLNPEQLTNLASKSLDSEKFLALLQ
jgi:translation initiation factor 4G